MEYDGWEVLKDDNDPQKEKKLGKGGQGTVYLARSPQSVTKRRTAAQQVRNMLGQLPSGRYEASDLAAALSLLGSTEGPLNLAALKVFDISSEGPEEQAKAIARLTSEINALKAINHPAVLKLLHSNIARRCMVTQYHPRGPLSKNLHLFKGNSLAALKAFSQLLTGVDAIHKQGAIHRDIKTDNIFVAESGGNHATLKRVGLNDGTSRSICPTFGKWASSPKNCTSHNRPPRCACQFSYIVRLCENLTRRERFFPYFVRQAERKKLETLGCAWMRLANSVPRVLRYRKSLTI